MVALLEEASLQSDEATRRQLLTFVTAGGGFSGTETTGAVNDFVRETVRYYPQIARRIDSSGDGSSGEFHSARIR